MKRPPFLPILALAALPAALSCGRSGERAASSASSPRTTAAPVAHTETEDVATRRRRPAGGRAPVIWLGLDGLDWDLLDRLSSEGKMPNWKRITEEGSTAKLRSFVPILSPVIWTTLATGVGPDLHRVLDFQEVDPVTGQKVPISGRSRALPAIWNVASAEGRTVGVVGWWGTHPAEEVKGFFVSDHASPILFEGLPKNGLAYPASLAPGIEQITAREGTVTDEELTRFADVPLSEIAAARASGNGLREPLIALARTIGATRVSSRIARELYDRNLPDLTMLYLEGTDVVGHVFAADVPPRLACTSDADFARYRRVVDEYYALVDRLLGQWMRRAEEDGATLIINSDHGFKWGEDRSCSRDSLNPATAGFWHRLDGVFAAWGARVRRGSERGTASVFDVAPTVAALLDLPLDRRAAGTVISSAFPDLVSPARKDLSSIAVRRLATDGVSEREASEYTKKLLALGYLSGGEPGKLVPPGGDRPGLTEGGWNNLGLYLSLSGGPGRAKEAEAAFHKALELRPDYHSPQFNLAGLLRREGRDKEAIDWLFRSFATGHADPGATAATWGIEYQESGKPARAKEILERAAAQYPADERVARQLAVLRFKGGNCGSAQAAVARFEGTTQDPDTLNILALLATCTGRPEAAIGLFRRSLALKPDQPGAIRSLEMLEKGLPASPEKH